MMTVKNVIAEFGDSDVGDLKLLTIFGILVTKMTKTVTKIFKL